MAKDAIKIIAKHAGNSSIVWGGLLGFDCLYAFRAFINFDIFSMAVDSPYFRSSFSPLDSDIFTSDMTAQAEAGMTHCPVEGLSHTLPALIITAYG